MQGTQVIRSVPRLALALVVWSLVALTAAAPQAHAAAHGQPEIVVGANAPANERFAAQELQRYFAQLTGSSLPVVDDSNVARRRPASLVLVGQRSTNTAIARLVAICVPA